MVLARGMEEFLERGDAWKLGSDSETLGPKTKKINREVSE